MKPINLKNAIKLYENWKRAMKNEDLNYRLFHDPARLKKDGAFADSCRDEFQADKGYLALCAALDDVQKRARTRTISARELVQILVDIENTLSIPKATMNGISVVADPNARTFPNSYKGIPEGTVFAAEYRNGWRVTDIRRARTHSATLRIQVNHTDESRAALVKRFSSWG